VWSVTAMEDREGLTHLTMPPLFEVADHRIEGN
jgi:hypothetical protein